MKFTKNIILNSDSYKYSQYKQYPPDTKYVYSYIESRGGEYDKLVFFGLQAFIKEYLTTPITRSMIDQARQIMELHGEPFNLEGWEYILNTHCGVLPIEIKSVDEGTVMYLKNVLVTVVNTDPKCFWLTSFLETALLRAIWYPTTVATNSYISREIILAALEKTGDPTLIDFKLNDFGSRGASSLESSALGGMGHLINFMGTDNVVAIMAAQEFYNAPIAGFSIPAMEHSTVTSWGRDREVDSYKNMLDNFAKPGKMLAAVSDSYDIYAACKLWGTVLKDQVLASGATIVIRPDSGEPSQVVVNCLRILDQYFGHTVNIKNFKVLNPAVRVIQGDGIDHSSIHSILFCMELAGYSADNVAFGQGGALLQMVNRDTLQFAMKASSAYIGDKWVDVYKDPITAANKKSKKGQLMLVEEDGKFVTQRINYSLPHEADKLLLRFRDGKTYNETTFEEIRSRAKIAVK
jgi:nicotinamide phosphoribosyltransferase